MRIHLISTNAISEDLLYIDLLGHLSEQYIQLFYIREYKTIRADTSCYYDCIKIMPFDNWNDFNKWCQKTHNVDAWVKTKSIDQNKIWWPFIVDISLNSSNDELMTWMKMRANYIE